jgi:hypothetical protein
MTGTDGITAPQQRRHGRVRSNVRHKYHQSLNFAGNARCEIRR